MICPTLLVLYSCIHPYRAMDEDEDEVLELLGGTVLENNRNLRRKLIDFKKSRDKYLFTHHYNTLQSFLPESVSIPALNTY